MRLLERSRTLTYNFEMTTKLGIAINEYCKKNHLSIPKLAEILKVDKQTVYDWRKGRSKPKDPIHRKKLQELLKLTLEEILGMEEGSSSPDPQPNASNKAAKKHNLTVVSAHATANAEPARDSFGNIAPSIVKHIKTLLSAAYEYACEQGLPAEVAERICHETRIEFLEKKIRAQKGR